MPPAYPDNPNPDVRRKPAALQGGWWATAGSILGALALVLDMLPRDKYPWVPAATALIGWVLNYILVPSYTLPAKPKPEDPMVSLQKQVSDLQKHVGMKPTERPVEGGNPTGGVS